MVEESVARVDENVVQSVEDAEKRKNIEFVEKTLSVLGKSGRSDSAVTTIQKLFTNNSETLPFITNIPSAKRVTVVSAHAKFLDDTLESVCVRLKEVGLYSGELVVDAGGFERFVLEEYTRYAVSVDGKRAEQVLDSLGKEYFSQKIESSERSTADKLFGRVSK